MARSPGQRKDSLQELLKKTRARARGKAPLVLREQMGLGIGDDELVVLVLSKRHAVAQLLQRGKQVDLRDLELGATGATIAVEQVGPRHEAETSATLTAEEQKLLKDGLFEEADPHPSSAAERGSVEFLMLLRDSLSAQEAATLLKVNPSRIRQRIGARQLYGIKDGPGWRLPRFQFAKKRLVPGIERVLPVLPEGLHPVAVQRWFRLPHSDLETEDTELTPLEWLSEGRDPARVAELASLM